MVGPQERGRPAVTRADDVARTLVVGKGAVVNGVPSVLLAAGPLAGYWVPRQA
jgi:hypothetical protein